MNYVHTIVAVQNSGSLNSLFHGAGLRTVCRQRMAEKHKSLVLSQNDESNTERPHLRADLLIALFKLFLFFCPVRL